MKRNKQYPDFLHIGDKILKWYRQNGRDLPFRKTKDPYKIWICEIVFQQTRIEQGLGHYERFIERFPDVYTLAGAETDEVLLYWKGLGYYSRALNIHTAAQQIVHDFQGIFPKDYADILKLKGVGKYTAAAVSSICFGRQIPAVDGNFYRVLSRIFADNFDVSTSGAFNYFSELSLRIMPENEAGNFNQAMMDLGSEICRPKNPKCSECPVQNDCLAYSLGKTMEFPVKLKKTLVTDLKLQYFFIECEGKFLIRQRKTDFIWKKLYEFPTGIPENIEHLINKTQVLKHKLTHKNLEIEINALKLPNLKDLIKFAEEQHFTLTDVEDFHKKSFPKPLENFIVQYFSN